MNKISINNFFEDFAIGQQFECPTPRVITHADRVAYITLTGDRTPRFCDSQGLVHPLIVFHTVFGQSVRHISLNARANLGYGELTWERPVHVGDELRTTVSIIGLKENSNRQAGIVYVRTTGMNQRNETVIDFVRWVMVKKNRESETPYLQQPVTPTVETRVTADRVQFRSPDPIAPGNTGGKFYFEDYVVGERIFHYDGMTVNAADHMGFARLYQNSARVHFDSLLTDGHPLVYGGYPISVGYALQFNGFENRLGIAAINSGSHTNPLHADDVLYAFTDVLERADLSAHYGGLRLRLVVTKNEPPHLAESFVIMKDSGKKEASNGSVVIDLDFWEVMAKKGLGQ